MTNPTNPTASANPLARPAEQFHWLVSGIIWHTREPSLFGGTSEISLRGQTVTLTDEMLSASPWLALLGDEQAQVERWGQVRIMPGPWPDGVPTFTPNSPEHVEAREAARRAAWRADTPQQAREALAEVERVFGRGPTTSRTVNAAPTQQPRPTGNARR